MRTRAIAAALGLTLLTLTSSRGYAQTGAASTSGDRIAPQCASAAHREFDYWLGEWNVTGPQGGQVGTNHVILVSDGCAVLEQWRDARGVTGTSINFYNASTQKWEQHWMGGQGGALFLSGGLHEGNMRLEGKRTGPNGSIIDRVTWIRMDDGKVRQHWESSADDGKTWTTAFDGVYAKESAGVVAPT
jgi:hypothetical protein